MKLSKKTKKVSIRRGKRGGVAIFKFNGQTQRFLDSYGHIPITAITLCKEPIQSFVSKALTLVTNGRFDNIKKKMGYDEMYHVFALLTGQDQGRQQVLFLEKNQTILGGVAGPDYLKAAKSFIVTMNSQPKTLNEMIENTKQKMGIEHFFDYRGFDWNCQDFLINFLDANGLLTQGARDFLFQDTNSMFNQLPGIFRPISKAVTDLAGYYDHWAKQ
jgi:hypothetical protein